MPAFFLSFLACAFVIVAGREQVRVARLSAGLGAGAGLFAAIWISAIAASVLVAWVGSLMAPMIPGNGKLMFLAMAMLLASLELVFLRPGKPPAEPTRSVGAILLVLLAKQATDGARFLVLALCVVTGDPVLAGIGGALGSGIALSVAAMAGREWEARLPLRLIANLAGAALTVAAIFVALSARGAFG